MTQAESATAGRSAAPAERVPVATPARTSRIARNANLGWSGSESRAEPWLGRHLAHHGGSVITAARLRSEGAPPPAPSLQPPRSPGDSLTREHRAVAVRR